MHDLRFLEASITPLFARPIDRDEAIRLRRELDIERVRRAEAEATAEKLSKLVAGVQAELKVEREARTRAESAAARGR